MPAYLPEPGSAPSPATHYIEAIPYQENDLWYVPIETRSGTGQSETQNIIIKFYELEGKPLCFIIGSKEKGVVD